MTHLAPPEDGDHSGNGRCADPGGISRGGRAGVVDGGWSMGVSTLHLVRAEQLGLPEDGLHGFFLEIRRIAELVQDAFHFAGGSS